MKIIHLLAAAVAIAAAPIAASAQTEAQLIGPWDCNVPQTTVQPGVSMAIVIDFDYRAGGEMAFDATYNIAADGVTMQADVSGLGAWRLAGDLLSERVTAVAVDRMVINGENYPVEQLPPDFADSIIGQPETTSQIVSISDTSMVVLQEPLEISCVRG